MSRVSSLFRPDPVRWEGVRPIQIYLLRLMFVLTVLFVGRDSWSGILRHEGPWDPVRAAAVCMWAGYSALAVFAAINPLRWLPLVLFEIVYKSLWLLAVAYPLWSAGELAGSPAAAIAFPFAFVIWPIVAMPWGYAVRTYVWPQRIAGGAAAAARAR